MSSMSVIGAANIFHTLWFVFDFAFGGFFLQSSSNVNFCSWLYQTLYGTVRETLPLHVS